MILTYISFFVGILLLIILPVLINNNKLGLKLNKYFIIIILIAGLQRFHHGLQEFGIINPLINPLNKVLTFAFFIPPLYLIFIESLLFKKTTYKKEITLFGIAAIIILLAKVLHLDKVTNQMLFLLYSTTYLSILLYRYYKFVTSKKSIKELAQYESIKKWTLTILLLFTSIYISANYSIYIYLEGTDKTILNKFNCRVSQRY